MVVTSSGRIAKRPRDKDMYQEEISDDEEEEDEVESDETSEYGDDKKDDDYNVDSDFSVESDCFDYDKVKKHLLRTPGIQDISVDRANLNKYKD